MSNTTNAQSVKDQADTLWAQGDLNGAIAAYTKALELDADFFQAHANLGSVYAKKEDFEHALKHYEQAIALQPEIAALYSNTAEILNQARQYQDAEQFAEAALQRDASFVPALNNLGNALLGQACVDAAIEVFQQALQISPDAHEVLTNLGDCYRLIGEHRNAADYFEKSLAQNPDIGLVHHKLAVMYGKLGLYEKNIEQMQQALALDPTLNVTHSNYLFLLNTRGSLPENELYQEFLKWDEVHGKTGRENKFTHNRPATEKTKLRIGYVSPDFRKHSVSFFFESIIGCHDKSHFEIYCYANVAEPDEVTKRLQQQADAWRDIYAMPDQDAAKLIYDDEIDILVDLAGHTGYNRLKIFTYKPAPVQATYLGGATTTGLRDMDYWITDAVIHPENTPEPSAEKKYRLPRCFYSYTPPPDTPDVLAESRATVPTFGSFNDYRKITDKTIEMWAKVLQAVPESVLLLKHRTLFVEEVQDTLLCKFKEQGIDKSRIHFADHTDSHAEHFAQYNNFDVALDPFPFTGATTTIDTLWMGVPTVTLAGGSMASRYSVSFLHAVGLDDLVAKNVDEYVEIAKNLITDKNRLAELRKSLRQRMQDSELCDGAGLTRALEKFYHEAYARYLDA